MALKPWSLPNVAADTATDLVNPAAGKEVAILGMVICNTGSQDAANVTMTLTDSANTVKGTVFQGTLEPGESVFIDTKICLAASETPDKLRVLSSMAATSFIASGDEG